MSIQPGIGYTFTSSGLGTNLNITEVWSNLAPITPTNWTPTDNGDGTMNMTPGTINSLIPCIDAYGDSTALMTHVPQDPLTYDFSDDEDGYQYSYIYLVCGVAGEGGGLVFPDTDYANETYPTVLSYPARQNDDDTYGYILLCLATKKVDTEVVTFTRFITNSLMTERHEYTEPNTAFYYFYRV